jgi:hypothetical protein
MIANSVRSVMIEHHGPRDPRPASGRAVLFEECAPPKGTPDFDMPMSDWTGPVRMDALACAPHLAA